MLITGSNNIENKQNHILLMQDFFSEKFASHYAGLILDENTQNGFNDLIEKNLKNMVSSLQYTIQAARIRPFNLEMVNGFFQAHKAIYKALLPVYRNAGFSDEIAYIKAWLGKESPNLHITELEPSEQNDCKEYWKLISDRQLILHKVDYLLLFDEANHQQLNAFLIIHVLKDANGQEFLHARQGASRYSRLGYMTNLLRKVANDYPNATFEFNQRIANRTEIIDKLIRSDLLREVAPSFGYTPSFYVGYQSNKKLSELLQLYDESKGSIKSHALVV